MRQGLKHRLATRFADNPALWLVVLIPLLSIVMGAVTLTVAMGSGDAPIEKPLEALSKTSWKSP